jgi:nucleotide-binding universal stress UspA family protein
MTQGNRPMVVAVDFSEISSFVLEHALDAANRFAIDTLHVVSVIDTRGELGRKRREHSGDVDDAMKRLQSLIVDVAPSFTSEASANRSIHLHVRIGNPAEEIAELASEARASLAIVGRHGWSGRKRWLAGSVPDRLLALTPCAVMVAQPADYETEEAGCDQCVALRADSDGERWFCEEHTDPNRENRKVLSGATMAAMAGGMSRELS